jgi:GT2 family glycosyltransferase
VSGADVAVARNLLAEKSKDIADYIMFIDDDVLLPANAIVKLISHEKDIITGLYFAKQEPHFPQIFTKSEKAKGRYDSVQEYKQDSLIEIDACGAGCLLIKAEVFKKLKRPYFQYIPKGENNPRKGEDFYFCEKAKEAGYKIFCDTSIICKHIGTKCISKDHWDVSLDMLKNMKEKMGEDKFNTWKSQFYDN